MNDTNNFWRRVDWLLAAAVALAAFAWRLPIAIRPYFGISDEAIGAAAALQITRGQWPAYLPGGYVGPLQEYLAAPLLKLTGVGFLAFRLPAIVMFAAGAALLYLGLVRFLPRWQALCVAGVSALASSTAIVYTGFAVPEYGAAVFLLFLILYLSSRLDASRTIAGYVTLGVVSGVALWVFEILAVPLLAALVWLLLRSEPANRLIERMKTDATPKRMLITAVVMVASAGVLGLPFVYLMLQRGTATAPAAMLGALAGLVALGAATLLVRTLQPRAPHWLAAIVLIAPILLIPRAIRLYDTVAIAPQRHALELYDRDMGYTWTSWTNWPYQVRLLLGRVIPRAVVGQHDLIDSRVNPPTPMNAQVVLVGLLLLAAFVTAAFITWRRHRGAMLRDPLWLYLGPLLLMLVVLTPSSRLFGEYSYRYLVPFLPCLWLGLSLLIPIWRTRIAPAGLLIAALAAGYFAVDVVRHHEPRHVPVAAIRLHERTATSSDAPDAALVGQSLTWTDACEVEWFARGRVRVGSLHPQRRAHYADRDTFADCNTILRVHVEDHEWAAFWGDRARQFDVVESWSTGVSLYRRVR